MEVYYCGFNGFNQVRSDSGSSVKMLTFQGGGNNEFHYSGGSGNKTEMTRISDVAVCWNFIVVLYEKRGLVKYGMIQREEDSLLPGGGSNNQYNKENKCRVRGLENPPGNGGRILQVSASPRHLLAVTESGETWTHEDGKGWRRVKVGFKNTLNPVDDGSSIHTDNTLIPLVDLPTDEISDAENEETPIMMIKTSCGDNFNLGLDSNGCVYSLPNQKIDLGPYNNNVKVKDITCGKEHCLLLTENGRVFSWGGGSRGQLGHGNLNSIDSPKLIEALDGVQVVQISAGGWHSAVVTLSGDLYTFGWNESGQLAQTTNLAKPAECFSAVEKLLMACCTMQPEDAALPRGDNDTEDGDVYRKPGESIPVVDVPLDPEKDTLTMNCYNATSCSREADLIMVQSLPIHVPIIGKNSEESHVINVSCGSRHTVVLTKGNNLWSFGWNKYGQLGLGHTASKDSVEKMNTSKISGKNIDKLICGDWGTAIICS